LQAIEDCMNMSVHDDACQYDQKHAVAIMKLLNK